MPDTSLCVVAGEPSGDLHGARLITTIKQRHPDWRIWGVGSAQMAAAGCELWQDARDWGLSGIVDVVLSLPRVLRRLSRLTDAIVERKPTGVVLIDYPGFNLRLAKRIHAHGARVLYYIVPQLWAWGPNRIKVFQDCIDRAIVAFGFEQEYFRTHHVTADWVGHPLTDVVAASAPREIVRQRLRVGADEPLVTLLPGARHAEFRSHWDLFRTAAQLIAASVPRARIALGLAPTIADRNTVGDFEDGIIVSSDVYDLIAAADLVITKPGTATVECALLNTPMISVYRTGSLNYAIARRLVRIDQMAMPNILLKRTVVPEFLQNDATPEGIAASARQLLNDKAARSRQLAALSEVRDALGSQGAVARAAGIVDEWIGELRGSLG
ncbi:MAG TPA: lipid-A-disaccharide synthase [candidate division Zixibacteria bacterium]|jgi:lipid-A-disaccharide synthase